MALIDVALQFCSVFTQSFLVVINYYYCHLPPRLMRVGVKYEPARDALTRCVQSTAAVNHYYNALSYVHQSIVAGMSVDPFGGAIWAPRLSSRISES